MQFGMIGLGRMGANMVRRLMRNGHTCVVYDRSAPAVEALVKEGAAGSASLAELVKKLDKPRAACLMVPAAFVDKSIDDLVPLLEKGDTLIDGGNSNYQDDIAREAPRPEGPPLRGHGDERGRVGPGARILPDDRGRERGGEAPGPDLRHPGP